MDSRSPMKTAQWTTDSPPLSPVQGPPQVTPPRRGQPDIVDAEACPDPALVGAATSGDTTVVATMDAVNRTPSPQTTFASKRLKRFTERITKVRQPPLLELPEDNTTNDGRALFALPKRSKQITAQSLSHIPASKRGEHLV